jgi:hypothetical protein
VTIGTLAFLFGFKPTDTPLRITLALGVVAVASIAVVWWLLRSQPRLLSRFLKHQAVHDAETRVFQFVSASRERIGTILLLDFLFHAAAVIEIYVLLRLLVGPNSRGLLMALVLGTVERLVMIVFKFVPLRLGVDQVGSGSVASVLGLGSAVGVTIATVRTARTLFWAAVGLGLLAKASEEKGRRKKE